MSLFPVAVGKDALTMHLTFFPLSFVLPPTYPFKDSKSMSLVILVLSFVCPSIGPSVLTFSMHVVVEPFSNVFSAVNPLVRSLSSHLVVGPVPGVVSTVRPEMRAEPILFTLGKMTIEPWTVSPAFNTLAMIQIIFPIANVSLFAIVWLERTETIGLIVLPFTLICVSVWAPELSFAICLVIEPLSFVFGVVWP